MSEVQDIPSTYPPVNLTSIGGLLGLGFTDNGLYANTSLAKMFSLTLSPSTADFSWYTGYETQEWPSSMLQLGYNDTAYSKGVQVIRLSTSSDYWLFDISGFGFNSSTGVFTNLTSGDYVGFDLSLQGIALTPDAYDSFQQDISVFSSGHWECGLQTGGVCVSSDPCANYL